MPTVADHPLSPSVDQPDLTGRMAQCTSCPKEEPSTTENLAFFEYRGDGSHQAKTICGVCGYHAVAHNKQSMMKNVPGNQKTVIERGECTGFVPRGGLATDAYYCGCRGWD